MAYGLGWWGVDGEGVDERDGEVVGRVYVMGMYGGEVVERVWVMGKDGGEVVGRW